MLILLLLKGNVWLIFKIYDFKIKDGMVKYLYNLSNMKFFLNVKKKN